EAPGTLAPLVNQLFGIQLRNANPQTFYVSKVQVPSNVTGSLICGNEKIGYSRGLGRPYSCSCNSAHPRRSAGSLRCAFPEPAALLSFYSHPSLSLYIFSGDRLAARAGIRALLSPPLPS